MTQRLLAAACCALLLIGCTRKAPAPPPAPGVTAPTEERTAAARDALMKLPGVLVGRVVAGPLDGLVAVEDLPSEQFPIGSTITFVDPDQEPVGGGVVVSRTASRLHVRVVEAAGLRGPQVGDLAVRVGS